MELLVTLRNTKCVDKLRGLCDGLIVGTYFSSGYKFKLKDLVKLKAYCKANNFKLYIDMTNFISEDEKDTLINYLDFLNKLDVDGIYYHDLGVYKVAQSYNMLNKLIYDGGTVMCNSLEVAYYMSKGINGVKISSELTIEEIKDIVKNNPNACDLLIFGHLRMSYSKRKFINNYFNEIGKNYDYFNKNSLYLIEEKRDYKMPIVEDYSGTKIYTDYIFEMYGELSELKPYLKRGIIDNYFINDERIVNVLRDYKRVTVENSQFLLESLNKSYPDNYSDGYLYEKTNISKDE